MLAGGCTAKARHTDRDQVDLAVTERLLSVFLVFLPHLKRNCILTFHGVVTLTDSPLKLFYGGNICGK